MDIEQQSILYTVVAFIVFFIVSYLIRANKSSVGIFEFTLSFFTSFLFYVVLFFGVLQLVDSQHVIKTIYGSESMFLYFSISLIICICLYLILSFKKGKISNLSIGYMKPMYNGWIYKDKSPNQFFINYIAWVIATLVYLLSVIVILIK
jgi:hypothetical protein